MDKLSQLNLQKGKLLEELGHINAALAHPEYGSEDPYNFDFKPGLSGQEFSKLDGLNNSIIAQMVEACNYANVNFLPDIVVQMVEEAAFERFKGIIKRELEGKPIKALMQIKNVLERKMLMDQKRDRDAKLAALDAELDSTLDEKVAEYGAPSNDLPPAHEVEKKRATKKK